MQKKFIINLLFLIGINLLVKPFWIFGIDRSIQNLVGAGEYGLYFAVMNFSFLFGFILDFGLTSYNNRQVARDEKQASSNTSSMLGMKAVFAFLYAAISIITALIIGYDALHFKLFLWVGLNQILASFILFLRSNISGLQLFKTDSVISVLDRLLMILFFSVLLWSNLFSVQINIFWFAALQTLSYFITFLVALYIVQKKTGFRHVSWNVSRHIHLFKKSLPFAMLAFLMLFYFRADSVMIERLLKDGTVQAGTYASAFRILDALNMFAYLFSVLLLPLFSRMLSQQQDTGRIIHLSSVILLSAAIFASATTFFHAESITNMLYNEHQLESAKILQILIQSFIPVSAIYIFGTLLTANGNLRILNLVAAAGVIVNIGLNLLLIPRYFGLGAAWSGLITQSMVAITHILLSVRLVKPIGVKKTLLSVIIFGVVLYGSSYVMSLYSKSDFTGFLTSCVIWILFLLASALMWLRKNRSGISEILSWKKN